MSPTQALEKMDKLIEDLKNGQAKVVGDLFWKNVPLEDAEKSMKHLTNGALVEVMDLPDE